MSMSDTTEVVVDVVASDKWAEEIRQVSNENSVSSQFGIEHPLVNTAQEQNVVVIFK